MNYPENCPKPGICKGVPDQYLEGGQRTLYDSRFLVFLLVLIEMEQAKDHQGQLRDALNLCQAV